MNQPDLMKKTAARLEVKGIRRGRRPVYHLTAPSGWLNDPNGLSFFKNKFHLFYQYNPFWPDEEFKCWGHWISDDMLHWRDCPPAILPDSAYDQSGCASGSALVKDGRLHLCCTGSTHRNNQRIQSQVLVKSDDGIEFVKHPDNPILGEEGLPPGFVQHCFKDPEIFVRDGQYYMLLIGENQQGRRAVLLYRSGELERWDFVSVLMQVPEKESFGWVCPDFFEFEGRDFLILSTHIPQPGQSGIFRKKALWYRGTLDVDQGTFTTRDGGELDAGNEFYATQTLADPVSGARRVFLIGWFCRFDDEPIPESAGWRGILSLPRQLTLKGSRLLQKPLRELESCRSNHIVYRYTVLEGQQSFEGIRGQSVEIRLELIPEPGSVFRIDFFRPADNSAFLEFDSRQERLTLNGKDSITIRAEKLNLQIFLDVFTIEIFINHGESVLSATLYTPPQADGIRFCSQGTTRLNLLEKWDIRPLFKEER